MNYTDCFSVCDRLGLKLKRVKGEGYLIEDYRNPGVMVPCANLTELSRRVFDSITYTASLARRFKGGE